MLTGFLDCYNKTMNSQISESEENNIIVIRKHHKEEAAENSNIGHNCPNYFLFFAIKIWKEINLGAIDITLYKRNDSYQFNWKAAHIVVIS